MTANKLEVIHISYSKVYRVGGVTFEWHRWYGPSIINRHTEEERPYRNVSGRNWAMIGKFCSMTDEQKEFHRIY